MRQHWLFGWMAMWVLVMPGVAFAGRITLGGLDPTPNDHSGLCGYDHTIYVEASRSQNTDHGWPGYPPPASSPYLVPSGGGTITSWSVSQLQPSTQIRLAVVSFGAGATSLVVDAYSPIETISSAQGGATVTYPAHIPVRAGEEIALDIYGFAGGSDCSYGGTYSDLGRYGRRRPERDARLRTQLLLGRLAGKRDGDA